MTRLLDSLRSLDLILPPNKLDLKIMVTRAVLFVVFSIVSAGFINNFISPSLGTFTMDLSISLAIAVSLITLSYYGKVSYRVFLVVLLALLFAGLVLMKAIILDTNSLSERLLGSRNYLLYLFVVTVPLILNREHIKKISFWILISGTLICLFAVTQFIFRGFLPSSLLKLNSETNAFGFYGTDLTRSNGLVGNTIIFTGFAITIAIFGQSMWLTYRYSWMLIGWVSGVLSMIFTFSRAGWVAVILASITVFIIHYRGKILPQILITMGIIGFTTMATLWIYSNPQSFVTQRLLGTESTTQGSTDIHTKQILDSIGVLKDDWLFGVGVGSQGTSATGSLTIITDGWIFQAPLELGIPIACILLAFIVMIVLYSTYVISTHKDKMTVTIATTVLLTSLYYLISGSLNSAYVGKTTYALYWLLAGMLLSTSGWNTKKRI